LVFNGTPVLVPGLAGPTTVSFSTNSLLVDRFCGLVVRAPGYSSRGVRFDSRL
jgi:hypothetical protein